MEYLCKRFPLLAVKVFKNFDDQSLVATRKMNQIIKEYLVNEKIIFLRIICKFNGNFVEFKESWRMVVKKASLETIKPLASLVQDFFAYQSNRYTRQWHPLHITAERGHIELCIEITKKTGDKNPPTSEGFTPFHLAAQEGHTELCRFFVENLEDKNPLDNVGYSVLHFACIKGHVKTYKFLTAYFEDKNPRNNDGDTPLKLSARNGHVELCNFILRNVTEKNPANNNGVTPLYSAAANGNFEIFKAILGTIQILRKHILGTKLNRPTTLYSGVRLSFYTYCISTLCEHLSPRKKNRDTFKISH